MKVKALKKANNEGTAESPAFIETGEYSFVCPGCGDAHIIPTKTKQANGAIWGFNGDVNKPTFTPSILVRSGHYATFFKGESDDCWCTYEKKYPPPFVCYICHSFITDGRIRFLTDCTHKLAGKTVELPDINEG